MATGSKSARSTPDDGDAFLSSAMTATRPVRSRAARNGRAAGAPSSRRSNSAAGTCSRAAATSRRLLATIVSRMVPIAFRFPPRPARPRMTHDPSRGIVVPDSKEIAALLQESYAVVLAWLLIAGAGGVAALAIRTAVPRLRPLPPQRLRATAWTGPLVVAAFLLFYLL